VFDFNTVEKQALFQSGWFIEGLLSQTLIIHMIRTSRIPFFQSTAAPALTLLTLAVMAIGVWIPFSPLAESLQMRPESPALQSLHLPGSYFLWLAGTLVSYCVLTQLVKMWYIRRFQSWL
jgi:Mg2+-importing ATPase